MEFQLESGRRQILSECHVAISLAAASTGWAQSAGWRQPDRDISRDNWISTSRTLYTANSAVSGPDSDARKPSRCHRRHCSTLSAAAQIRRDRPVVTRDNPLYFSGISMILATDPLYVTSLFHKLLQADDERLTIVNCLNRLICDLRKPVRTVSP